MKSLWYRLVAKVTGKNLPSAPKELIAEQMTEPRPLPMGRTDFYGWAHRIMTGALVPNEEGMTVHDLSRKHLSSEERKKLEIFEESQKFALANMLMHLGPTESHKADAFFIHSLRKFAVNQVADTVRKELHEAAKARTAKEEAEKAKEANKDGVNEAATPLVQEVS